MRRRDFIKGIVGSAVAWPLAARAQQPGKVPTIVVLGPNVAMWGTWTTAFTRRLGELGWIEGRNIAIEYRWSEGHVERVAALAAEFVQRKSRCYCYEWNERSCAGAGDVRHSHCLCDGRRSGRQRSRGQFCAPRRQRHRAVTASHRSRQQTSRTSLRGCPQSPSLGDYDKPQLSRCRTGEARGRGQCPCGWPRCRAVRCSEDGGYYYWL